jgi:hypothetical protein
MNRAQVYFIECSGRIKIGFSKDVQSRLRKFATGSPFKFSLLGAIDGDRYLEHRIHKHLVAYREHGEWFRDCDQVRSVYADLRDNGVAAFPFEEVAPPAPPRPRRDYAPRPQHAQMYECDRSPMHPALVRIEACMQRYLGMNSTYPMSVKREMAAVGFPSIESALRDVGALVDAQPDHDALGIRTNIVDLLPAAAVIAARLESALDHLFAPYSDKSAD